MESSSRDLLNSLIEKPPDVVLEWIRSGGYVQADSFNWLGLIEVAGSKATSYESPSSSERGRWAEVAIEALRRAEAFRVVDHHEVLVRRLNMAAALSRKAPPAASAGEVARLFLDVVPFSLVEVNAMLERSTHDTSLLLPLRRLKHLITPVQYVLDNIEDHALRRRVDVWVAVRSRLP
jgi:hypothetical protein